MSLTKASYSMITGAPVNVLDYGADPSGTNDSTLAIQSAIDACSNNGYGGGVVYVPSGIYLMRSRDYVNSAGTTIGRCCLIMRNGVTLQGANWGSQLKLDANQYSVGTYFRMIASDTINMLTQASIRNITINGNRANNPSITDGNNILLEVLSNVVIDNVNSIASNGNGILLRGTTSQYMSNVEVTNCYSYNHSMIGIQCSQFNGLVIDGNIVQSTDNNCIDIYGDSGTPGGTSHSVNFVISNNVCTGSTSNTGIFPETVANGVIIGNTISSCNTGVHCNTINNQPNGVTIEGNNIYSCGTGVQITGPTTGVRVINNFINNFTTYGIYISAVNYGEIQSNYFTPASGSTNCVLLTGTGSAYNRVFNNTVNTSVVSVSNPSFFYTDSSTSGSANWVGGFIVTPGQLGPDNAAQYMQLNSKRESGAAATSTISVPSNTAGFVMVSVKNSTNYQSQCVPYVNVAGTVTLGTAYGTATVGSATITSYSTSTNGVVVNMVTSSGNLVNAGVEFTQIT